MIERLESQGNILIFRATGKLTDDDYEKVLVPSLEAVVQEHGSVRFLFYLDEGFQGWEPKAMWDDCKVGLGKLRKSFTKLAVVGGPKWVHWGMKIADLIMPAEVKVFNIDQLPEAQEWIRA